MQSAKLLLTYTVSASVCLTNNSVFFPGDRVNCKDTDFSDLLPEDLEQEVKENAEISMGTEVSDEDIMNIKYMCEQVSSVWQVIRKHLILQQRLYYEASGF